MIKLKEFTLRKLARLVKQKIADSCWLWDADQQLTASGIPQILGLSDAEVSKFATASCGSQLWVFRALASRLGLSTRQADWFWHNHC